MNCGFAIFDRLPVLAPYEANPRILSRIPGSSENLLGLKKWCPRPDFNRDKRFRKPLPFVCHHDLTRFWMEWGMDLDHCKYRVCF